MRKKVKKMFWKREEPKRIKDIERGFGIFRWLLSAGAILPPWENNQKATTCDYGYYYHSGLKIMSYPIAEDIFENNERENIALYIWNMYGMKWTAYWNALNLDYDAISNNDYTIDSNLERRVSAIESILGSVNETTDREFVESILRKLRDLTQTSSSEKEISSAANNIDTDKIQDRNSKTSKDSTNIDTSDSFNNNEIYGFNSDSPSDSDNSITTQTSKNSTSNNDETEELNSENEKTRSNVNTNSNAESNTDYNAESTANETKIDKDTNKITKNEESKSNENKSQFDDLRIKHEGRRNITPQSMLEEELELRKKIFLDIVYGDIDDLITIQVY